MFETFRNKGQGAVCTISYDDIDLLHVTLKNVYLPSVSIPPFFKRAAQTWSMEKTSGTVCDHDHVHPCTQDKMALNKAHSLPGPGKCVDISLPSQELKVSDEATNHLSYLIQTIIKSK